jgi:transcriptional regulator with XRE-family HTH domain
MDSKNFSEIIGNNILQCLQEEYMEIKTYAKIIGVTRQTVKNYIDGLSIIDSYRLYLTANKFHKRVEWFFEEIHIDNNSPFNEEQEKWIRNEIISVYKGMKL